MYKLYVCDDDVNMCLKICNAFELYAEKQHIDIQMEYFTNGERLIDCLEKDKTVDMIFLDIKFEESNGIEIGNCIREKLNNENVQIVYISSYQQYAMQLFQVRPFDFLIKPFDDQQLINVFEKYKKIYKDKVDFFEYKIRKHVEHIPISEICYFMCEKRKIYIVTKYGKITYYGKMKELHESICNTNFWSVHNSFIINVNYVKRFKDSEIIMSDDVAIPISHTYKKAVREKIMNL